MKIIHKYRLGLGQNKVEMPAGAKVLTAQMQGNSLVLWAGVNPNYPTVTRKFIVIPTGFEEYDDDKCTYISTIQSYGLVYHIFEEKIPNNVPT